MLIKDYYSVTDIRKDEETTVFEVSLNPDCEVYKGHFPGEPISPGVCNVQMIKECAETVAGKPLTISNVQLCRFLSVITPQEVPSVSISVKLSENEGIWSLVSSVVSEGKEYMSLKAELKG